MLLVGESDCGTDNRPQDEANIRRPKHYKADNHPHTGANANPTGYPQPCHQSGTVVAPTSLPVVHVTLGHGISWSRNSNVTTPG